jgi:hypothetical protein
VPGYVATPSDITVDGETVILLVGSSGQRLPLAGVFTHENRAFLLFVYHELPGTGDDRAAMMSFLAQVQFAE